MSVLFIHRFGWNFRNNARGSHFSSSNKCTLVIFLVWKHAYSHIPSSRLLCSSCIKWSSLFTRWVVYWRECVEMPRVKPLFRKIVKWNWENSDKRTTTNLMNGLTRPYDDPILKLDYFINNKWACYSCAVSSILMLLAPLQCSQLIWHFTILVLLFRSYCRSNKK